MYPSGECYGRALWCFGACFASFNMVLSEVLVCCCCLEGKFWLGHVKIQTSMSELWSTAEKRSLSSHNRAPYAALSRISLLHAQYSTPNDQAAAVFLLHQDLPCSTPACKAALTSQPGSPDMNNGRKLPQVKCLTWPVQVNACIKGSSQSHLDSELPLLSSRSLAMVCADRGQCTPSI